MKHSKSIHVGLVATQATRFLICGYLLFVNILQVDSEMPVTYLLYLSLLAFSLAQSILRIFELDIRWRVIYVTFN